MHIVQDGHKLPTISSELVVACETPLGIIILASSKKERSKDTNRRIFRMHGGRSEQCVLPFSTYDLFIYSVGKEAPEE